MERAQAEPLKVVELFTSQGCSSCPPADRLAERLVKENEDLLTLVLPVDYWDYLGWKDTLASPVHSERQRAYAARRGDRSVYTPQMVINGEEHVVGSREGDVRAALARAEPFTATVDVSISDMAVQATVDGVLPAGAKMATVYFLGVEDEETISIGRGENAGRKIRYVNVVRNLEPMGMWSGGSETFRMPKSKLMLTDDTRCAVLIQVEDQDGPGTIIGAAVMDWEDGS
ncbi:DUF1223 domain-containing protein [Roseibium sp.]|uniref:DUF1223 domain-containing protein n=1 Tax=Roseibium sp. TaxID=1936156 RepID=UPI003D116CED